MSTSHAGRKRSGARVSVNEEYRSVERSETATSAGKLRGNVNTNTFRRCQPLKHVGFQSGSELVGGVCVCMCVCLFFVLSFWFFFEVRARIADSGPVGLNAAV